MDITKKRIGVWGLGVSGKAITSYLLSILPSDAKIALLDQKNKDEIHDLFASTTRLHFFKDPEERDAFFDSIDYVIPSPGIDLTSLKNTEKIFSEIDLFSTAWKKSLIAITGTLGKTSVTHLLSLLLSAAGEKIATGGNIGIGMLDLVQQQKTVDYAVLELSSFQLEHSHLIAPDLAIITNIYPNHLDRHKTFKEYIEAKLQLILHQTIHQQALLPFELYQLIRADKRLTTRSFAWFAVTPPQKTELLSLNNNDRIFSFDTNGSCIEIDYQGNIKNILLPARAIPPISFKENWLVLASALHLLNIAIEPLLSQQSLELSLPHNRLEPIATINGVSYINDSKSTIMQASITAIKALKSTNIILLLGGVSKGVDRTIYLKELASIYLLICFGKEAETLAQEGDALGIKTRACKTLEDAVQEAYNSARPGDIVLLSPGGASFDLFTNYEERGKRFVELVNQLKKN